MTNAVEKRKPMAKTGSVSLRDLKTPKTLMAKPLQLFRNHPKHQRQALNGVFLKRGLAEFPGRHSFNRTTGTFIDGTSCAVDLAKRKKAKRVPVKYVETDPNNNEKIALAASTHLGRNGRARPGHA